MEMQGRSVGGVGTCSKHQEGVGKWTRTSPRLASPHDPERKSKAGSSSPAAGPRPPWASVAAADFPGAATEDLGEASSMRVGFLAGSSAMLGNEAFKGSLGS